MVRFLAAIFILLGASQASAQSCFDLWVERNAIFDNRGYCFGSALGKTYFNNSDCHTKSPSLSASEQRRVSAIKSEETRRGCKINTAQAYNGGGNRSGNTGNLLGDLARGMQAFQNRANTSYRIVEDTNNHVTIECLPSGSWETIPRKKGGFCLAVAGCWFDYEIMYDFQRAAKERCGIY